MNTVSDAKQEVKREQSRKEERLNAASHGLGCLAACVAMPFFLMQAAENGDSKFTIATLIFCITMILLYSASTAYHFLHPGKAKRIFGVIDHSAIFLFIAGTYTPFTIGVFRGTLGWSLFVTIWALAIIGVTLKVLYNNQHPIISNTAYLLMGWLIVFAMKPLVTLVPLAGVLWLSAGGIAYTLGIIFFVLDSRIVYSHFIWHLFVLVGSICHAIAIYWYAL